MASLLLDFRTNHSRDTISHMDISLLHRDDFRKNRYTIITTIPSGDLMSGIRLTRFDNLDDSQNYRIVPRLFLLNQPFFVLRPVDYRMGDERCSGWGPWKRCSGSTNVHAIVMTRV